MEIDFLRLKDKSVILLAVSLLFEIVSLIVYGMTGLTEFTAELSTAVFIFGGISLAFGVCIILLMFLGIGGEQGRKVFDIGIYIVYLLGLLAWLFYITSEINYLTNIFVGIDGTKPTPAFIMTVAFFLIAWATALISAILYRGTNKTSETK
ncbi:MAG: hypothetical protein J6Z36_04755 [Clostridia bacterium]|nr:hypothetical protein [Clostridia bacterium]